MQLTTLGDKIDRARSIFHLFGDKIDRLKSFLPFWEAKIEKKCHFYFLFGYKTGRKRRESRKKWKKSRAKAGGLSILSPNAPQSNKALSKKLPRIGDINFSYFLYFIFQHITKKKGRNKFAPVVADKCINFKKKG